MLTIAPTWCQHAFRLGTGSVSGIGVDNFMAEYGSEFCLGIEFRQQAAV